MGAEEVVDTGESDGRLEYGEDIGLLRRAAFHCGGGGGGGRGKDGNGVSA